MDIEEIKKRIISKETYLNKEFNILEIGIFGSFIREEQHNTSDIDILCIKSTRN